MKRIQRKRTKGWKMPDNAVYVGRPTKWGNPFKLRGDQIYINASYRRKILSPWVWYGVGDISDVVHLFRMMVIHNCVNVDMQYWHEHFKKLDIEELRGKDLACWCPLDKPCHADFLIEVFNASEGEKIKSSSGHGEKNVS